MIYETRETSRFAGYEQVDPRPYLEKFSEVGITLKDPPRLFHLQSNNRLWLIWQSLNCDSPYLWDFALSKDLYGGYSRKHNVVFTREGDAFTVSHEYAHVFVEQTNPDIYQETLAGYKRDRVSEKPFAFQSLNEGVAQWVAIWLGLNSEDFTRQRQAIRTHNLMTTGKKTEDRMELDVLRMQRASLRLRAIVEDYCALNLQETSLQCEAYQEALKYAYVDMVSVGYVFVSGQMRGVSSSCIGEGLTRIIQNPPCAINQLVLSDI